MVPGDPSKPFEHPELEWAAKDVVRRLVQIRRRRHGLGRHGVRSRPGSAVHRHRQWWTVDRNFRSQGKGDNLFLSSILAIKPDSGRLAWHFQQVPGDQWDYTTVQPLILGDLKINGRDRRC
ncbi:MAG: hypothetical protein WDO18_14990 [Acidobacteriota bacterium]